MSRGDAKRAARMLSPGTRLTAYPCGDYYHLGKLSPTIARGYSSRDNTREYPPSVTKWSERRLGTPPPGSPAEIEMVEAFEAEPPVAPNPGMLRWRRNGNRKNGSSGSSGEGTT